MGIFKKKQNGVKIKKFEARVNTKHAIFKLDGFRTSAEAQAYSDVALKNGADHQYGMVIFGTNRFRFEDWKFTYTMTYYEEEEDNDKTRSD